MAFVIGDRVRETSTTTGTGNFTLAGAVTGYQTFDAVLDTNDTTYYTIADQSGANFEVGIGTFTAPATLARTTILSSSNGGSAVTFTSGTKDVFISLPASKTVQSFSAGSTGLTPSTASFGAVALAGTLVPANGGTGTSTAFTAGSVVFAGASGVYAQANADLFWDDTNDRLGIGTNSPDADLTVKIASFGTGAAALPSIAATGDLNTGMWFPAADTIAASTGGSERLRIDSSGNVGIGTSSPVAKLNVKALDAINAAMVAGTTIGARFSTDASGVYIDGTDQTGSASYQPLFIGGSIFGVRISGSERLRIDTSGSVGIGTTSPSYQLTIQGTGQETANLTDAGNKGGSLFLRATAVGAGSGGAVLFGTTFGNQTPFAAIKGFVSNGTTNTVGDLAFSTRDTIADTSLTERMRLTYDGNLQFNSGYGSVATAYGCRAWVNFNGTGTVAIRGSGNVSSITDNGTGDYTVNFTTAMPDANYAWAASGQQPVLSSATGVIGSITTNPTTSALRVIAVNASALADFPYVCVAIFR